MESESGKKEPSGQSLYETLQMVSTQEMSQLNQEQLMAFDVLVKCGFLVLYENHYRITADARQYMTDYKNQQKLRIPFIGTRQKYFTYAGAIFLLTYAISINLDLRMHNRSLNSWYYGVIVMSIVVGVVGFINRRWLYLLNITYALFIFMAFGFFFYTIKLTDLQYNKYLNSILFLISSGLAGASLTLIGGCIAIFRKQYRLIK